MSPDLFAPRPAGASTPTPATTTPATTATDHRCAVCQRAAGPGKIDDQILAAELWVLGLQDWVDRNGSSRSRRPTEEIARKRHQLALAGAVVETLRAIGMTVGGSP